MQHAALLQPPESVSSDGRPQLPPPLLSLQFRLGPAGFSLASCCGQEGRSREAALLPEGTTRVVRFSSLFTGPKAACGRMRLPGLLPRDLGAGRRCEWPVASV